MAQLPSFSPAKTESRAQGPEVASHDGVSAVSALPPYPPFVDAALVYAPTWMGRSGPLKRDATSVEQEGMLHTLQVVWSATDVPAALCAGGKSWESMLLRQAERSSASLPNGASIVYGRLRPKDTFPNTLTTASLRCKRPSGLIP